MVQKYFVWNNFDLSLSTQGALDAPNHPQGISCKRCLNKISMQSTSCALCIPARLFTNLRNLYFHRGFDIFFFLIYLNKANIHTLSTSFVIIKHHIFQYGMSLNAFWINKHSTRWLCAYIIFFFFTKSIHIQNWSS